MTLIIYKDSAHDFIVKFSASLCSVVVASLTGKTAAQNLAYESYYAYGTADSDKSHGLCAMTEH